MSWLSSFLAAIITAILTSAAAGLVAAGCVSWYRVSSREGGSGYFIAFFILLGVVAGFFAGLFLAHAFGGTGVAGFFKGLGISSGSMVGLAGMIALIAWGLADIPPTLNGHELDLVVDARLPKGAERPAVIEGKQFVWFESGPRGGPARARAYDVLDAFKARLVDDRWVVPGSVRIITSRNPRTVTFDLGTNHAFGFELRFPGHPGAQYKQWSGWIPDAVADHWPDSRMSFRFRIEERIPEAAPVSNDPFLALTADSPLADWLKWFDPFARVPERYQAIMKQVDARPAELARLVRSPEGEDFGHAMNVVQQLKIVDPAVAQAMRDVGAEIEKQIREFNGISASQPGAAEPGERIHLHFKRWALAWVSMPQTGESEARLPVEEILKLAEVRNDSPAMQAVASDARNALDYLRRRDLR